VNAVCIHKSSTANYCATGPSKLGKRKNRDDGNDEDGPESDDNHQAKKRSDSSDEDHVMVDAENSEPPSPKPQGKSKARRSSRQKN